MAPTTIIIWSIVSFSAGGGAGGAYDARAWQPHVLAHLPAYGVLVPLAAEAAAARVRARGQEPAATLLKVAICKVQQLEALPEWCTCRSLPVRSLAMLLLRSI